jgi:hypothetical protein
MEYAFRATHWLLWAKNPIEPEEPGALGLVLGMEIARVRSWVQVAHETLPFQA